RGAGPAPGQPAPAAARPGAAHRADPRQAGLNRPPARAIPRRGRPGRRRAPGSDGFLTPARTRWIFVRIHTTWASARGPPRWGPSAPPTWREEVRVATEAPARPANGWTRTMGSDAAWRRTTWGEYLSEFLGTFVLIAFGTGVVAMAVVGLPGSGRGDGIIS